jgi:hypothetical protein
MDWLIAQLSVWARNRLPVEDIKTSIANVLYQAPLYIYIPVYEDPFGKNDTGFGEYAFINYMPDIDYYVLEDLDEIVRVLKEPHTKRLQLLTNDEVWEIKDKADAEVVLSEGDVVRVISGPVRQNYGIVQFIVGNTVNVVVYLGQESLQVTLPFHHVRKSLRRTSLHKKEAQEPDFDLSNGRESQPGFNFGEMPRVQILRRGVRKTKVSIDNKVYQISNSVIDKILLSSGVLDEQVASEMSRIISSGDHGNGTSR